MIIGIRNVMEMKKMRLRHWACISMCMIMFLTGTIPAFAADSGNTLELKLKVGSTIAVINGQQVAIGKPYIDHLTTMVPLGVFKRAFESQVRLENSNQVKVTYGTHTLSMTIDSHLAWVDGKKVKLDVAPTMKSDTLMVPVRFVAQGIGAKIGTSSVGEIVITLESTGDKVVTDDTNIDSDVGKTKLGNSYYNWTMNYPTGLIIGEGGGYESIASFNDSEESYYIEVHANKQEVELQAEDILQQLVEDAKDSGEVVLDRESYPLVGVPYARIVTKDSDGTIWEVRGYYDHEQLYEVYLADFKAQNYKEVSKYSTLLNSFKTNFNKQDKAVKDLSSVVNGMRNVYNGDYGISLDVPAGWDMDNENMYYESEDGSYLKLNVTSAPKGSSLEQWSGQMKKWLGESFVNESYKVVATYPIVISGSTALVNEVQYNYGDGWTTEYEVMLEKNGFRYYAEYGVPEDQKADLAHFKDIMKSIDIEYEVVSDTFGRMEEDAYLIDKSKIITKSSKAYKFKLNVPQFWTPMKDRFESSPIEYQYTGGRFMITAEPDTSVEEAVSQLRAYYNEATKKSKDLIIRGIESTTFAGVNATVFKLHQVKNGIPYEGVQMLFSNNGITYTVTTALNDANATQVQKDALEKALKSFAFTKLN
ncbi:stalk domain-containing protein [Paenibacillus macquariensis]|uniref:Copper amine oxidase N-terminal domain-containing protein n=1 Tax=Paenibacillus macquariensis TaxID=948756 RepID=A0ABY1K6F5_9BACL|nr:stalk domain-containing protein [Paenibacillus macquariensis]MEC0093600.1 stalk domain-containing protein [Paenibacillus macquariensis]OAB35580.1 copper amine oxidase [Paenibacillus macquariensis subsp. macquariensis]SIR33170.1 Copper amine oxidase N-terminal domain-containing protein [Paenibacillus macquariensis]